MLWIIDAQRALPGLAAIAGAVHAAVLLSVRGSYSDFLIGEA
jgi:hypothetical protein